MKRIFMIIMICFLSTNLFSQYRNQENSCVTIGVLQGGGSLIGADFEFLLSEQIGFQFGLGLIGLGGGLNYHFKRSIRSSFISLQYWNQGLGSTFVQNVISSNYVFRGKKWFTFQIGLGVPLDRGPAMPEDFVQPDVMLTYAIGVYIPY